MRIPHFFVFQNLTNNNDEIEENDNNYKWVLIFHHNSSNRVLFKKENKNEVLFSMDKNKYSILRKITEKHKIGEYYEFMLKYPQRNHYIIWKQKTNPIYSPSNSDVGFELIEKNTPDISENFDGLALSSQPNHSYLDGMIADSSWFYSIGAYQSWGKSYCFPGPYYGEEDFCFSIVDLYIKIKNENLIYELIEDKYCTINCKQNIIHYNILLILFITK